MDFLLRRTEELADRYGMLQAGDHILAGVSGGADSVCLLYLLRELAPRRDFLLEAVHVEHGIRGAESESDCVFVRELCARLEIPLSVEHIRVPDLAKALGQGTEETAREERYRIFLETALKTGANKVAVAHNLNDQAETVLWNLTRGSSLRGLGGIRPVRSLGKKGGEGREIVLIRPLIGTRRREIESFLMEKGIPFCTDRTNEDREITRNRIRLSVLPELEALNSRTAEHISLAAEQLRETEDYLARLTAKAAGEMIRSGPEGGTKLLLLDRFFREDPLIRQRVLRECIRGVMPGGSLKDVGRVQSPCGGTAGPCLHELRKIRQPSRRSPGGPGGRNSPLYSSGLRGRSCRRRMDGSSAPGRRDFFLRRKPLPLRFRKLVSGRKCSRKSRRD